MTGAVGADATGVGDATATGGGAGAAGIGIPEGCAAGASRRSEEGRSAAAVTGGRNGGSSGARVNLAEATEGGSGSETVSDDAATASELFSFSSSDS